MTSSLIPVSFPDPQYTQHWGTGNETTFIHILASFPGHSHLQFLITCSIQKWPRNETSCRHAKLSLARDILCIYMWQHALVHTVCIYSIYIHTVLVHTVCIYSIYMGKSAAENMIIQQCLRLWHTYIVHMLSTVLPHDKAYTSLVPRPPPFFVLRFAISIIHGSGRSALAFQLLCIKRKPKNKNGGGLGTRLPYTVSDWRVPSIPTNQIEECCPHQPIRLKSAIHTNQSDWRVPSIPTNQIGECHPYQPIRLKSTVHTNQSDQRMTFKSDQSVRISVHT